MPCKQFFPTWGGSCCLRFTNINTRRAFRHTTTIHQIPLPDFIIPLRCVEAFTKSGKFARAGDRGVPQSHHSSCWKPSSQNLTWEIWHYNRFQWVKRSLYLPTPQNWNISKGSWRAGGWVGRKGFRLTKTLQAHPSSAACQTLLPGWAAAERWCLPPHKSLLNVPIWHMLSEKWEKRWITHTALSSRVSLPPGANCIACKYASWLQNFLFSPFLIKRNPLGPQSHYVSISAHLSKLN